ncbi:MAG: hypothetical protein DCC67_04825 [Planctomycetota bacterium]|nr:MAG: hypothetical protein DCC67_04825 [Planctomycetota bacterium]
MAIAQLLGAAAHAGAEETSDELIQAVVQLLRDPDKDIRALALDQVRSELPGEAATKALAAELPNLPAEAQAGLAGALADRGDRVARAAILALVDATPDEAVRAAALESLGTLGNSNDVKLLVGWLGRGTEAIRAAARRSLLRLPGDEAVAALAAELKAAPPELQASLVDLLKERRGVEAVPQLLELAVGDDAKVRGAAISALAELARPADVPAMVAVVLKAPRGAERDAAERAVAAVCSRGAEPDQRALPLLAAMEKLTPNERLALLSTLGRVGGAPALAVVQQSLADADFNRHELGLRALCNWPDASIAPHLAHLAASDEHPAHRRLALRALVRIAPLDDGRSDAERLALLRSVFEMCESPEDKALVVRRAAAIRSMETLRFVTPLLDDPQLAQAACETVVELAHDRPLREPHKAQFHPALDKVIATSRDPVVVDRAERYKRGQTWRRPR